MRRFTFAHAVTVPALRFSSVTEDGTFILLPWAFFVIMSWRDGLDAAHVDTFFIIRTWTRCFNDPYARALLLFCALYGCRTLIAPLCLLPLRRSFPAVAVMPLLNNTFVAVVAFRLRTLLRYWCMACTTRSGR